MDPFEFRDRMAELKRQHRAAKRQGQSTLDQFETPEERRSWQELMSAAVQEQFGELKAKRLTKRKEMDEALGIPDPRTPAQKHIDDLTARVQQQLRVQREANARAHAEANRQWEEDHEPA